MDISSPAMTILIVVGSIFPFLAVVLKMVQTRLVDDDEKARMDAEYLGQS